MSLSGEGFRNLLPGKEGLGEGDSEDPILDHYKPKGRSALAVGE